MHGEKFQRREWKFVKAFKISAQSPRSSGNIAILIALESCRSLHSDNYTFRAQNNIVNCMTLALISVH
ncbi:hypothetical protein SK128_021573 [Halocaridina rubra]|uniref:Uncharacterized protein n=1 Tax=Halocaridina rubra TaxID=373956 RepID=A0AAN8WS08_HALRR